MASELQREGNLKVFEGLGGSRGAPEAILEVDARGLHALLGGPSLIRIPGRKGPSVLVSTLLHGDELSGWQALQRVLKRWRDQTLPRGLDILLGNLAAAEHGVRFLEAQSDHNRIWDDKSCPESTWARALKTHVSQNKIFAALDLHNNTGRNPHYACVAEKRPEDLHLARLFSRHVMHMPLPRSMFAVAFAQHAPTITCEAGLSGDETGVLEVERLIESVLHLSEHPQRPPSAVEFDLYELESRVTPNPHWSLCVGGLSPPDIGVTTPLIELDCDLDSNNFAKMEALTQIGTLSWPGLKASELEAQLRRALIPLPFELEAPSGYESSRGREQRKDQDFWSIFHVGQGGELSFREGVIPAMLTPSAKAIQMDCLCYTLTSSQTLPAVNSL